MESIAFKFRSIFLCFSIILTLAANQPARAAGTCYVNGNATGTNNGTSWGNAYTSLQSALADTCTEIWVAAGTYKPAASDRTVSFALKSGVALYGGFAGTETLRSQRNFTTKLTVLSGDLSANDSGFTNNGENSYHVVTANDTDASAILDGFTISGGNANGSPNYAAYCNGACFNNGGGMYILSNGSPTLTNLIFNNNTSANLGGGMVILFNSAPILTNVTFNNNSSEVGGGIENGFNSSVTLTNVTFTNNSATYGSGMDNGNNATLTNVNFTNNSAQWGGGMRNNLNLSNQIISLTGVTFTNNHASWYGGGMSNEDHSGFPLSTNPLTLTNVTFSDNSADLKGGGMFNYAASPSITNSTFYQNSTFLYGGGMSNDSESSPSLANVTFSLNIAGNGGGMSNVSESSPSLANVTFDENIGVQRGGGIYNTQNSNPIITNVTFRYNDGTGGSGIYNESSSPTLKNVIIANSSNGPDCVNSSSSLNSASSNNLIQTTGSGACGLVNGTNGNIIGLDPNLGPLTGSPAYFPLNSGSAAINAGTNTDCPSTDQRGYLRDASCDIGSYEYGAVSPDKDITSFSFTTPAATGVITGTNIAVTVPFGIDVTSLVANFTTTGASVKVGGITQVSGTTANNFTNPVTYRVTAADGTTKDYTVVVTRSANPAKDITSFSFSSPTATGVINGTNIAVTVPSGTNVTALVPTITHSGASINPNSGLAHDFTSPVTYTVTAADGTTKDYTVTVTRANYKLFLPLLLR